MISKAIENRTFDLNSINLIDIVVYSRPTANRTFDQIYMHSGDLLVQTKIMEEYIKDKNIIFLGDGDSMCLSFGMLSQFGLIQKPNSMSVIDFDERIVNNIEKVSTEYNFNDKINNLRLYNVIEPVPTDLIGKHDFFYINPPYGSRNKGISTIAWLVRCFDLCSHNAQGCIVIPYDAKQKWTLEAMATIQNFLIENGFVIRDMVSYLHSYHLPDNPQLKSCTLIVERIHDKKCEHTGSSLPKSMINNLYGKPRPIPRYIRDDGTVFGKPDYDWEFGSDKWLLNSIATD